MATTYDDLPRDVIKKIVSKMDIDTKVKLGLIFKLNVPQEIERNISKYLQVPKTYDNIEDYWFIPLGPLVFDKRTLYTLTHYYGFSDMVYLTTQAIKGMGTTNFATHDGEYDFEDEIE